MACRPCADKARQRKLKKEKGQTASIETTEAILAARHAICVGCEFHKIGECELLFGKSLPDYAAIAASACPDSPPKW